MVPPSRDEIAFNEQRADLEVFRVILQVVLCRLFDNIEQGQAMLDDLENETTGAIHHADERMRQMMLVRSESFFQSLRDAGGYPPREGRN